MKNKKRYSFLKIFTLFSALLIPAVVAVSCGTPQSNKYIGSVSQFDSLKLDPNSDPNNTDASKTSPIVNFSYYQLLKEGSTPTTTLRYADISKPNEYQVPSADEISKFTNTYGIVANALAYNIASRAAVFATTATNYNNSLPGKDKDPNAITLFTPDATATDPDLIKEFYEANANNLLIGDSENNIGFGVTDVSFKFQTISTPADLTTSPITPATWKDTDARLNNTEYPIPADTDLTANDTNNKLTKILKVTDINIYFRFFIAGSEGQGAPTRDSIIASNNSDYSSRVATLKDQWKSNYGTTLNTYAFDLQMQDMAARISFTAVKKKESDSDYTKDDAYRIEPSAITSIAPLALYNEPKIGVGNSKDNSLMMDPTLFEKITDYSKIMDDGTSTTNYTKFGDQQKQLQDVTNAFLNEINQSKPSVTDLKNKVIGGNKLNLTIEDYFNLYFKNITGIPSTDTANEIFAPGFNAS